MGTIEKKLEYLLQTKNEIKEAIQEKGVKVFEDDTFRSYADKIKAIQGKTYYVPSEPHNDVEFIDTDGGILYSYTKEEFLELSEMPPLPERQGLICQGWNWSFEDAINQVESYGVLCVGATYITDNGETRLYINISPQATKDISLYFTVSAPNSLVINWGDGIIEEISGKDNLNAAHEYSDSGDYVITFKVANDATLYLGQRTGSTSYTSLFKNTLKDSIKLQNVEIGSNTKLLPYCFYWCRLLQSITIPMGALFTYKYSNSTYTTNYMFNECYNLSSLVIPISDIESFGEYTFSKAYSLCSISIPNNIISLNNSTFYYCCGLSSLVLPNSIKSIGQSCFSYCSFKQLILPDSLTSIGQYGMAYLPCLCSIVIPSNMAFSGESQFYDDNSLRSVVIKEGVTYLSNYIFNNCDSLYSVVLPESLTSVGTRSFQACSSLISLNIPNGITTIPTEFMNGCSSIAYLKMPANVKTINTQAFLNCIKMKVYDFTESTQVPTLSAANAFNGIPSTCKIVVPDELYGDWIVATNWSSFASNIIKKTEFDIQQ